MPRLSKSLAIFHAHLKPISRGQGHSAVAAAAYRAGLRLKDERTGTHHDFTRKAGVLAASMVVPKDSPEWARDIATVWNRAEAAENRSNARVARDLVVALPVELPTSGRALLAHRIAADLVDRYGCAILVALHAPDAGGDARNFHAHLLLTTRKLGPEGFGAKVRVLDDRKTGPFEVDAVRRLVAERTNEALAAAGQSARVDHRTLAAQATEAAGKGDVAAVLRLTRSPTCHLGRAATAAVRRGLPSPLQAHNRAVARDNQQVARAGDKFVRAASAARPPGPSRGAPVHVGDASLFTRATGAGSRVLNSQATEVQKRLRIERDLVRLQVEALQRESDEVRRHLAALIAVLGASAAEAERLRQFLAHAGAAARVRSVLEAKAVWDAAKVNMERRRDERGLAAVRTAEARRVCDTTEAQKPAAWRALTRRQWAQKRRADRATLAAAESAEGRILNAGVGEGRAEAAEAAFASRRADLWAAVAACEAAVTPAAGPKPGARLLAASEPRRRPRHRPTCRP